MNFQKSKLFVKKQQPRVPRTIKDIEDTLKEMDKIHNTSFYSWIKDENNASVIAFKTKDLFQEHYEKQPELVYNALRFLCKDWKLSKIAELILKLFYKSNIASEKLAIIIYEVSLLLENPEKVDLISLLLIGEEAKNVAFFLYHFFQYTEKKYREHTEISNEEEFLDEMNAFCSGILECLYSCLKWTDDYFRDLILEYVILSTLEVDARREFLIRMVNVKYSNFQQEIQNGKKESIASKSTESKSIQQSTLDTEESKSIPTKEKSNKNNNDSHSSKIDDLDEVFSKSLSFGILVFNMFQVVMRTEVDDLLTITPIKRDLSDEVTLNDEDDEDENLSNTFINNTENDLSNIGNVNGQRMKKEESSATLWLDENDDGNNDINDSFIENSEINVSKDMSSIYNFGYDSSFCNRNINETSTMSNINSSNINSTSNNITTTTIIDESISENDESFSEFSYHFEELFNDSFCLSNANPSHDDNEIEDINLNEPDLFEDFLNKSFTSANTSTRRNSTISFASFMNECNLEDGCNNNKTNSTNFDSYPSSRRNSRYSLNLSIHSMPCITNINGNDERITSNTGNNNNPNNNINTNNNGNNHHTCNLNCNCTRYNNYSDNLLYVFPSPPSSPTFESEPNSPSLHLNDHEYDPQTGKITTISNPNDYSEMDDELENSSLYDSQILINDMYANNNNTYSSSNTAPSSPTISHRNSNSRFYRSFSPEIIPPSPILQSISVDNLLVNSYGYPCTFNHINSSSTPVLNSPSHLRDEN